MKNKLTLLIVILMIIAGNSALYPCGPSYYDVHHGYTDYFHARWKTSYYKRLFYPDEPVVNPYSSEARYYKGERYFKEAQRLEQQGDLEGAVEKYMLAENTLNGFGGRPETINEIHDKIDVLMHRDDPETLRQIQEFFKARNDKNDEALRLIAESGTVMSESAAFIYARHKLQEQPELMNAFIEKYPNGRYIAEAIGWKAHYLVRYEKNRNKRECMIEAQKLYLRIIENPKLHTMFNRAVGSLSFRYFENDPPMELLRNPIYAAGYVQGVIRSKTEWGKRGNRSVFSDIQKAVVIKDVFGPEEINALSPEMAELMAVAFYKIGEIETVRKLLAKSLDHKRTPVSIYLTGRIAADEEKNGTATSAFEELAEKFPDFNGLKELGLRIAELRENKGDIKGALEMYIRCGSVSDCEIITDGDISLKQFQEFMYENPDIKMVPSLKKTNWKIADEAFLSDRSKRDDIKTFLRKRLGVMLAREGQLEEAKTYFSAYDKRMETADKLIKAENDLKQTVGEDRPSALYRLAAIWYHEGDRVLYNGTDWLNYYFGWSFYRKYEYNSKRTTWEFLREDPWISRIENMKKMNRYMKALPYFMEIIEKYPRAEEVPKAMYSAACCYYWMSGQSGHRTYIIEKAEKRKFWEMGDEMMVRLYNEHPEHYLAKSEHVLKAVAKQKEEGK